MLTEQRYELILRLLEDKKSITVAEVRDLLRTSGVLPCEEILRHWIRLAS